MRRADRLFQIIQILRSGKVRTARYLAEELEVSERTIYRDVSDLMCSGVPIEGEAGIGYVLRRGYDLPPLMFSEDEIAALTLGARVVQSWGDAALAKAARQVLSKVEQVLPPQLQKNIERSGLFSTMVRLPADVAACLGSLRSAVKSRQILHIRYHSLEDEQTQRKVWPLGLFFWGQVWTLLAWCEHRDDFRSFRVDRIVNLLDTGENYPPDPQRGLDRYFQIQQQRCQDKTVFVSYAEASPSREYEWEN